MLSINANTFFHQKKIEKTLNFSVFSPFFKYCWWPDMNAGLTPANPHRKELSGVLTWGV